MLDPIKSMVSTKSMEVLKSSITVYKGRLPDEAYTIAPPIDTFNYMIYQYEAYTNSTKYLTNWMTGIE